MRSDIKVGVVLGLAMLAVLGGYYWRAETPDAVRLAGDKKPTQLAQAGAADKAISPPPWSSANNSKKATGSGRDANKVKDTPKPVTPANTPAPMQPAPSTPPVVKLAPVVTPAPKPITPKPLIPATPPLMSSINTSSQPASGGDKPPLVAPPKSETNDKKTDSTTDEPKPAPIRIPDPTHKPESAAPVVKPPADSDTKSTTAAPDRSATPSSSAKSSTATADKSKPEDIERVYEVKKNDTLAILSEHFYGSQKYVNFLLKANPQVDARRLKVGTKLRIPPLSAAATSQPAATGEKAKPAAETVKAASTESKTAVSGDAKPAESTYIVKPSDNFYSIARKTLGSGERWRELHQLNKDICPEPGNLKPGMKLRLPGPKSESKAASGDKSEAKPTSHPKEAKSRSKP